MTDGIINVYKEAGYTSHDVVAKLRGILHQKKIGHTGTLDPEATGVLPVCLGKGTRLCEMLTDKEKTYEAVLLLGVETDTQDMTGTVLDRRRVEVTPRQVENVMASFVGEQQQIPPMYSALKVNGRKLYELAREGKVIRREPRKVQFYEIRILEMKLPRVRFTVTCSKGTYIRTLCHDIGNALGCKGAMESLVRTRVGSFTLEDSVSLAAIEERVRLGTFREILRTPEDMFTEYPRFVCPPGLDRLLHNGNPLKSQDIQVETAAADTVKSGRTPAEAWVRAYDSQGVFIGIYSLDSKKQKYYPVKMFHQ